MEAKEPLLDAKNDRPSIFPIKYHSIWKAYKQQESVIWHAHEIKPESDRWESLNSDEQRFIKYVLAFFASSDMIVSENLSVRFMSEIKIPEARYFYGLQNFIEQVHSETYSKYIDAYISDPNEKTYLENAVRTVPCVAKKAAWARKWIESTDDLAVRMVAFAMVEGIFFSGSFCAIYWLNESGRMAELCRGNDFIARDEGMHTNFACLLYKDFTNNKLTQERFGEIMTEAVNAEIEFITEALPCRLIGINAGQMSEYIRYCANRLASQLGHEDVFPGAHQPFTFMDRICLREKNNFFELIPSAYTKFSIDQEEMRDEDYDDL